ncbi:MAG: hypothetical protein IKZ91_01105 [Bacteroidales bacterium]|nr:hypothetical protein [Bacteroidales bacterium]
MIRAGRVFIILMLLAGCGTAAAAAGDGSSVRRHTFRLGWGDMMFETAAYYPTVPHIFENPSAVPESFRTKENFSNWYTGHIFADYLYSLNDFLSVGGQVDFEALGWKSGWFDRNHIMVEEAPDVRFYNVVVMPQVRLTYLHKDVISVYSGLGAGVLLSFAQNLELSPALYVNLAGVRLGRGPWSGSVDLGLLNALSSLDKVYMIASRVISVSINYSW